MNKTQYPLLKKSPHKYNAIPFDQVKDEDFLPSLKAAIENAETQIEAIKSNSETPTFENTMLALETSGEDVSTVASTFYNLLGAHTNDHLQQTAGEFSTLLSRYSNNILLNDQIFQRVKSVYEQKETLNLSAEEARILEVSYSDFVRNGALLSEEKKETLKSLDEELSQLSPKYSENVLKATNEFELVLDSTQLSGLPESALSAARSAAEKAGHKDKWLFNLHAPSLIPFLKYSDERELREKLWKAYSSRSFNDQYDNQELCRKIATLRHQRAELLGYKTHAEFVLEKRMAESPQKVYAFLQKLLDKSYPAAQKDLKEVQEFANTLNGPSTLQSWDFSYYAEKLKEKKFNYNEEDLRPYFKLENVIEGVFEHARRLYQITFKPSKDYPVYHEDVQTFEVFKENSDEFIGVFYCDFFPRESKNGGAWMTNFYEQGLFKNEVMRPHVGIVCNFTKPLADKPSLLTFNEVRTLFHEFGHALHSLLSQCHYRSLSGTNVYWDFVELPSQILENWILEKESLSLFAKHYDTGETIPDDLIKKIKASSQFLAGYNSLRQLNFASLDMAWHDQDPSQITDVAAFEKQATEKTRLLPVVENTNSSCVFSHIFAGGYSSGYYSYKWAEVLDADAFEYFKEEGLFDVQVAQKFKENILERGGTDHPMELYKKFRGREPDPDALLRRDGLI